MGDQRLWNTTILNKDPSATMEEAEGELVNVYFNQVKLCRDNGVIC